MQTRRNQAFTNRHLRYLWWDTPEVIASTYTGLIAQGGIAVTENTNRYRVLRWRNWVSPFDLSRMITQLALLSVS